MVLVDIIIVIISKPQLTKNRWLILDAKKDPITQASAGGCPQS